MLFPFPAHDSNFTYYSSDLAHGWEGADLVSANLLPTLVPSSVRSFLTLCSKARPTLPCWPKADKEPAVLINRNPNMVEALEYAVAHTEQTKGRVQDMVR